MEYADEHAETIAQSYGLTPNALRSLLPTTHGKITVKTLDQGDIRVDLEGHDADGNVVYFADRELFRDPDGLLAIYNLNSAVDDAYQGQGIATEALRREVDLADALGAKYIKTLAAGRGADRHLKSAINGYYTWPRLGFDAPLTARHFPDLPLIPEHFKAEKVSDLMRTPEGRAWWKEHGVPGYLKFWLTKDSISRKVLDAYGAERSRRMKIAAAEKKRTREQLGEMTLTPEEEAILDDVWDRLDFVEFFAEWNEEDHPRGKTVEGTNEGSFRPGDGGFHNPNPHLDNDRDYVTDASRVGLPGRTGYTDRVPRLENLPASAKQVEERFAADYEQNPEAKVREFLGLVRSSDHPNTIETDMAKMLSPDYREDLKRRSLYNVALHQTASAIAKAAFLTDLKERVMKLPPEQRSILVTAGGIACHGEGTPVIMLDGSVKAVEEVQVGDLLMGPDSQPRTVLKLHSGHGRLFLVTPNNGDPFTVTGPHVLSLMSHGGHAHSAKFQKRVEITVDDLMGRGERFRRTSWLHRAPGVDFAEQPIPLDPYFLGLWLGDGDSARPAITSADEEVSAFMVHFAERTPGVTLKVRDKKHNKAKRYELPMTGKRNPLTDNLRGLGVLNDKHIPHCYLVNSRQVRLAVLAGLLDSDGYLDKGNGFDFITKFPALADGVVFLTRSLGFRATMRTCTKRAQTGFTGTYWRIHIGGDMSCVPTSVRRKQAQQRRDRIKTGKRNRNVLHTGYEVEVIGDGPYYGFTLNGDGLYLLGDFTVTHNSGKGHALQGGLGDKTAIVWDSAGEQNSTELPWLIETARTHGIRPQIIYVDTEPSRAWDRAVERAKKTGRMVDAVLFAESHTIGAKNFAAAVKRYEGVADFAVFSDRGGKFVQLTALPDAATRATTKSVYRAVLGSIRTSLRDLTDKFRPSILAGAMIGRKLWSHGYD